MGKAKKILLVLILLILLAVMAFLGMQIVGKQAMHEAEVEGVEKTALDTEDIEIEDNGDVIVYKGETYRYNENITSVLCMGVDTEELGEEGNEIGENGQADMLMLAILDTESGKVDLWNISREAMTEVDIYNVDGEYVRTEEMQLCLAYAYGDGRKTSCENTIKSVSRLLYGMPIQSYAVLNLEAIQPMNDAIGGVDVVIKEGDVLPAKFKPGTTVHLEGKDVVSYVRYRSPGAEGGTLDSNNNRMARQRQYMMNFIQKALQQTKEDITTPINLFYIAVNGGYMVTNLTISKISYLTSIFSKVDFSEDNFWTIPGEIVKGEKHAEYYVDDEVLYQRILDTFYIKEQTK